MVEAQQASFVESERRQLLRTVAAELEEVPRAVQAAIASQQQSSSSCRPFCCFSNHSTSNVCLQSERARRIVGSGIVSNAAVDNGNQRTSTSPALEQGHSSPSSAAHTADIPKRVRFQDSPVAANDASDDAAAASASAGGLGSYARAPLVSVRETNHAFQPAASSIRTSELQKATVAAAAAGGGGDSAAGKTAAATSPPTKLPQVRRRIVAPPITTRSALRLQDAGSDTEESQANLRLAAIALSGPGRLERLRGKSSGERRKA